MTPEQLDAIRQRHSGSAVVRELLDYIDGLKFANGVLDSAAKDAQAWLYEAQTAKGAYCELLEANRVTEAEGGAIAQLNGMIDELRAQLEAQRGGAVVVPDPSEKEADRQKRYVAALEGLAAKVKAAKLPRTIHNSGIHAAATTVEQIANEIGGRK